MSSLLAILLVVNSTRGHHFLFSYPPNPKRPVGRRNNKVNTDFIVGSILTTRASSENDKTEENIEGGSHSNTNTNSNKAEVDRRSSNASKSTNIHSKHSHNNTDNESKQDEYTGTDTIFQMDVSFLADALAPKSSLCDRKFQLSMDDLTFVGHPVSLSSPHQTQDVESTLHSHSPSPDSTTNHIGALPGNIEEEDDHTAYSSDITSASIHMTLFHVVFVIAPPVLELNAQVETLYQNVILRYSSALRYEQLRCGYVQEEIEKVLALKEEAFNKGEDDKWLVFFYS
ncbi:nitrogen permease regulator of amino acid transport activity 3-domain-containing protein [Pilobolus umbonatus]|nr:nitrogen permease regulator of amino acid transport activity 3-domain-containing protein [Pilobolus umbonatus]